MRPFAYAGPGSVEEALRLLRDEPAETSVLAGGTDLLALMKDGVVAPRRLVGLGSLEDLFRIEFPEEGGVVLGAMVPLHRLPAEPRLAGPYAALARAVEEIHGPQILNRATVGGNLCQRPRCWYFRKGYGLLARQGDRSMVLDGDNRYHAILGNEGPAYFVSPSSLAPVLIALGARVVLRGKTERTIALADFFRIPRAEGEREHDLDPGEILTEVRVPRADGFVSAFYEVRQRRSLDWPLATAAVALRTDGGAVREARVVMGQVAPVPWDAREAAELLAGKPLTEDLAARAGEAATAGARSLGRNAYKIRLARVAVKRALLRAAGKEVA